MPYKFSIVGDVSAWLKSTASVEKSLEEVAGSLDDLAADTAADADKAAAALETKFTDAYAKVKAESREAGRKVGDDLEHGTRKAVAGVDDLKTEAKQSARETAASFSDVGDALDLLQEVAANAFGGFGPAGLAAGAAAAVGIGMVQAMLDDTATKAAAARERVVDVADAVHDAEGNPALVDWAEKLRDTLKEVVDTKEWYEVWQAAPVDRLADWSTKVREFGLSRADVMKAAMGDTAALGRVEGELTRQIDAANAATDAANAGHGVSTASSSAAAAAASKFREELAAKNREVVDGIAWESDAKAATDELGRANAGAATGIANFAAAQERAAETSKTFSDNLTDHLSVADEGLDKFVHKGKLSLKKWSEELADRARETKRVEGFTVTIAPKLSDEALANFAKLPTDTQAEIAAAYKHGSKKDRKAIVANLEAEAKVTSVKVDTTGAKVDADPITIPATVDATGVPAATRDAKADAQREANRDANRVEFRTHIDVDELQRQVNRAAAAITPPTITVTVKPKKEVP